MDGAGDELLADAGLAPDEDGGIGVGDLVDHLLDGLHAGAVLEDPVVLGAAPLELPSEHLLSEPLDLPLQRGLLQDVLDRPPHVLLMERLGQEVARALLHRLDHRRRRPVGRDHDHGRPRAGLADALQDDEAVLTRQADVEEDHRRLKLLGPIEPFGALGVVLDLVPELAEHGGQRLSNLPIIVNDQNRRVAHCVYLVPDACLHDVQAGRKAIAVPRTPLGMGKA